VFSDISLDEAVPQVCKEGHFLDRVLYLLIEPLVLRGFVQGRRMAFVYNLFMLVIIFLGRSVRPT
jgi:hypothetical protein